MSADPGSKGAADVQIFDAEPEPAAEQERLNRVLRRTATPPRQTHERVIEILGHAKRLAQEYRRLTGKPLGITGEVAEYEAARILGVELTPARQAGYDALEQRDGTLRRLQIKGRCLLEDCKPGQRLGSIHIEKEWDVVLMVLLDENFDAVEIYEAERTPLVAALSAPGSKARTERGALAVSKFKSIGKLRWRRPAAEANVALGKGDV